MLEAFGYWDRRFGISSASRPTHTKTHFPFAASSSEPLNKQSLTSSSTCLLHVRLFVFHLRHLSLKVRSLRLIMATQGDLVLNISQLLGFNSLGPRLSHSL